MGKTRMWFESGFGKIVSYFLQGLLLLAPAFLTGYAIFSIFDWLDSKVEAVFQALFHFYYPGLGIIAMFFLIAFIGFIGSLVIVQPILHILDMIMEKTPVVKEIYTSMKDFFGAFISNKKKFNRPVMFEIGKDSGVYRIGFITQEDLSEMNILDKVAVYTPWSYNLSGILYLVNRNQVKVLEGARSADVMKFVMSGGVTEIDEEHNQGRQPTLNTSSEILNTN